MVQAMSLFNQLLQHFPRNEFAALVRKHGAEKGAKALPAGRNWFLCCSASWRTPIHCGRSVTV